MIACCDRRRLLALCGIRHRSAERGKGVANSVFTRFRDWVKADVWKRLFEAVSDEPDMEYAVVDATIVKVHRHGQGANSDGAWTSPRSRSARRMKSWQPSPLTKTRSLPALSAAEASWCFLV
jgi:transposase